MPDAAKGRRRGRRLVLAVAGAVAIAAATGLAVLRQGDGDAVGSARALVDHDDGWTSGREASDTMAHVTELLLGEIETTSCARERGSRCDGLATTTAWAQLTAVAAARCAPAQLHQIRADARAALLALADGGTGLAEPPPLARCR